MAYGIVNSQNSNAGSYTMQQATYTTAGIMKLYDTLGNNSDGTVTQAAITAAINEGGGSIGGLRPRITVTAPTGSTVTATKGARTLTATEDSGTWTFDVPDFGDWVLLATKDGRTSTKTISITAVALYEIRLSYFEATIVVTSPAGTTITCTGDGETQTINSSTGSDTFTVLAADTYTIAGSCNDGKITQNKSVFVSEETTYTTTICIYRYGYRIKKSEGDPSTRVEYLYDAEGLTPAAMDFTNDKFNYGSWGDKWFVTDNKPLMLKPDGTVDYYLDPDNYDYKESGSASSISDTNQTSNAMAQIPLCWVCRYEDSAAGYQYEIISNIQYDETYKAYAHTRADGSIADYFYYSMFGGSGNSSKIRSISGQTLANGLTAQQEIDGCKANGSLWYTHSWSQRELIRTLCVLLGKSTDTQAVFGNGNCRGGGSNVGSCQQTGTLKAKGQFYGDTTTTNQVKVFHIEKFWGDQWDRVAGLYGGKVKMTPEGDGYQVTTTNGYADIGFSVPGNGSFISEMSCNEYGMIPKVCSGSGTTYFPDACWGGTGYLLAGCCAVDSAACSGAFSFDVINAPSNTYWAFGCGLSCEQPV